NSRLQRSAQHRCSVHPRPLRAPAEAIRSAAAVSMTIRRLIEEAKRVYSAAGLTCGAGVLPPAANAEVDAIDKALSLAVPRELRQVSRVHGGQQYVSPGVTGLFGEHRLHSPAELVATHRMFVDNCLLDTLAAFPPPPDEWGYWVPQLLPFASWDAYALCI